MSRKTLYGFHAVIARLKRFPDSVIEIFCKEDRHDTRMQTVLSLAKTLSCPVHTVSKAQLDELTQHRVHQGVAVVINTDLKIRHLEEVLENLDEPPLLLILDGITDPHNLGACLRVADAMGAHAILAPKDKSASINATVSKVACGAAEVVPYIQVTNLARTLRELKDQQMWIVGTAAEAQTDLFHFSQTGPLAWVLGAEGHGIRRLTREHCDVLINIPMFGSVESLNVSVASGICLAESRRQRLIQLT
jgi:23S rRNA (guanosine2251-2'-O)-methyltransferase